MKTLLTTSLETVSDIFLLIDIVYFINIQYKNKGNLFALYKKQLITAIFISCIISIIFNQNFFEQIILFKTLLVFINFLKYIFLNAYIYKIFNCRLVITSLIIQFTCSNFTAALLVLFPVNKIKTLYILNIILNLIVRLIVLFIALYINYKDDYGRIQNAISIIPNYTFILIILSLNLSNGLIQTANFNTSKTLIQINMIKVFASLITIFMTVVLLTLLFNVISKKYQSDINTALEKQIETQLYHYKQLEKINAEIRKFKHDYINHVKCMDSMIVSKEYNDLSKYFHKISDSFPNTSFLFETGNYIADAILTEKQINSPDNISIEFDGAIPTDLDNVDLCIILSNALDNAVEACCLCDGNKIISVYSGLKHGYFVLKIKNPTINTNTNDKSSTTKTDKINHGFGLINIERTVKKYDGYVSIDCSDNIFTLNITFLNFYDN